MLDDEALAADLTRDRVADRPSRWAGWAIGLTLGVAAIARLAWGGAVHGRFDSGGGQSAGDAKVVSIQRFDPLAYVGVDAGPDGQPGIAGVDDGGNGVVDDAVELGAIGSDDRFRVIRSEQYLRDPQTLPLVLQRGAFVPIDDHDRATDAEGGETGDDGPRTRVFLRRRDGAGTWEVMRQQ